MLTGKSAIVTGSTSGIGQAIATMLAEEGCNVMLNGFGYKDNIEQIRKDSEDKTCWPHQGRGTRNCE
jgi:3-hydroxybutyrate dehydrogenase